MTVNQLKQVIVTEWGKRTAAALLDRAIG